MVSSYIAPVQCSVRFTHITPGHWTCSFKDHFNSFFWRMQHLQPFRRKELVAHIAISVLSGTHLHLSQVKHVRVTYPTTQHRNIFPILGGGGRNMILSENPAPSVIRKCTAGSDIGKAPRSNHCATSLPVLSTAPVMEINSASRRH